MAFIWHLTVVQFTNNTSISGVILNGGNQNYTSKLKSLGNAIRTSKSYFEKPYSDKDITIQMGDLTLETKTSYNGSFSVVFSNSPYEYIGVYSKEKTLIEQKQSYPIFFDFKASPKIVISDIDDTIMQSFTPTKVKRLLTTLFKPAHKRVKIVATDQLYKSFSKSHKGFCYVSKSEANLVRFIGEFITHHGLPVGPMFLTPYLSFFELIKNKKDPDFKLKSISHILSHSEIKTAILVGDDTQADMDVYTEIIETYKDKIEKVFIRQTSSKRSAIQKMKWEKLVQTGVNAVYYKDTDMIKT